jgi:hypothetical protein
MGDLEALGAESVNQRVGDRRLIFYQQDAGHLRISTAHREMPMKKV